MKIEAQTKPSGTTVAVVGFLIVAMAVNITMALHLRSLEANATPTRAQAAGVR